MAQPLAPFRIYDALYIQHHTPGFTCHGREEVFETMARTFQRPDRHHVVVVGESGRGKTALIGGLAHVLLQQRYKGLRPWPLLHLDTSHLIYRLTHMASQDALLTQFEQALAVLPPCILAIDDMARLLKAVLDDTAVERLAAALTGNKIFHTVLFFEPIGWAGAVEGRGAWKQTSEVIYLEELPEATVATIVAERAKYIAGQHQVQLQSDVPGAVVELARQLPGAAQPQRSLQLLQEVCAAVTLESRSVVERADVEHIFVQRIGQSGTAMAPRKRLQTLRTTLQAAVIGQPTAVEMVAGVIERGWLGLKNPERPLGSFLFLGPSGVGKTELARVLAQQVYGRAAAFVRIDMSEYQGAHSVQRLIGAPPGYVGYEAGGQLTGAVRQQPFCLILLDEIEKADPAVFDVFLQILEDGRLTDGQGATVDFSKTIIIATSNIGVERMVTSWQAGEDITTAQWRQHNLLPILTKRFRLEFLNRFEGMAVFQPLTEAALAHIARLELHKITERLSHHRVMVNVPPGALEAKIRELADPRFGARPLKRWLETTVETAVAQQVLARRKV